MNEDRMTELEPRAGETLERMLERYARVRLDPTAAQAKRARGAVMEAAWRRRLAAADLASVAADDEPSVDAAGAPARPIVLLDATGGEPPAAGGATPATRRHRWLFAGWGPRRLGGSLAAAVLAGLLVGSSAFAATRAGGPLYDARLAFEELTLPSDATARLEAELAQAQGRLAEIVDGVVHADGPAVAAATRAYLASIDELGGAAGVPADRALAAVRLHQAVLQDVLGRAPAAAQDGLENALARSEAIAVRLTLAGTHPSATPGASGSNGNGGANGASNGGGGTGGAGNGAGGNNGNGPGSNSGNGGNGGTNPNQGPGSNSGGATRSPVPAVSPVERTPAPATPEPTPRPTKPAATPKPTPDAQKSPKPDGATSSVSPGAARP